MVWPCWGIPPSQGEAWATAMATCTDHAVRASHIRVLQYVLLQTFIVSIQTSTASMAAHDGRILLARCRHCNASQAAKLASHSAWQVVYESNRHG